MLTLKLCNNSTHISPTNSLMHNTAMRVINAASSLSQRANRQLLLAKQQTTIYQGDSIWINVNLVNWDHLSQKSDWAVGALVARMGQPMKPKATTYSRQHSIWASISSTPPMSTPVKIHKAVAQLVRLASSFLQMRLSWI